MAAPQLRAPPPQLTPQPRPRRPQRKRQAFELVEQLLQLRYSVQCIAVLLDISPRYVRIIRHLPRQTHNPELALAQLARDHPQLLDELHSFRCGSKQAISGTVLSRDCSPMLVCAACTTAVRRDSEALKRVNRQRWARALTMKAAR